ncbi:AAA family ATPase [Gordonia lacunae]|uniref:AAA family ATPase n=1 Tax=Gordonia lacunae TaxID=417102 RepID=UPI0039E4C350
MAAEDLERTFLFVGVGVDNYDDPGLENLSTPIREVHKIAGVLGDSDVYILEDPRGYEVDELLLSLRGKLRSSAGNTLMVWSGHGLANDNPPDVRLLQSDSDATAISGHGAREIIRKCAAIGCSQLLCVIDTCSSGAVLDAAVMANDLIEQTGVAADEVWVGVIVACRKSEYTPEARLGEFIAELLTSGPDLRAPHGSELRRRWSFHSKFIRGDDLCDAVLKQWNLGSPLPNASSVGNATPMLPNPLWSATALATKASSLANDKRQHTFVGRDAELATVEQWLDRETGPGVWAIVGSAGTGKSALASQAVLAIQQDVPSSDRPTVYVTVVGQTLVGVCKLLDSRLSEIGYLPTHTYSRNAFELLGAIQRALTQGAEPPVIVLDGITQATQVEELLNRLINPLAELGFVLAITRPGSVTAPTLDAASNPQAAPKIAAVQRIEAVLTSPDRILDLDSPQHRESGWDALAQRIALQLAQHARASEADDIMTSLRSLSDPTGPAPFVLAEILCDRLEKPPANTTNPSRGEAVIHAVDEMVDSRLEVIEHEHQDHMRRLLEALSWAQGLGLPEALWLTTASAIDPQNEPSRDDIDALLNDFGSYIIEDTEFGEAVYRFAHDLITHRVRSKTENRQAGVDSKLRAVQAILSSAASSDHARTYGWRYVAETGIAALRLLDESPYYSMSDRVTAALTLSINAAEQGDTLAATRLARRAATLAEPNSPSELHAYALVHLGNCMKSEGDPRAAVSLVQSATQQLRNLAREDLNLVLPYVAALHNLASYLQDLGRLSEALRVADEVVAVSTDISNQPGGDNSYNLGISLNVRALIHAGLLDSQSAVVDSRAAVSHLRSVVETRGRIGDTIALAQSLTNLGRHLALIGDLDRGAAESYEAVTLLSSLPVNDDESIRREYAGALNDYSNRLSELGRIDQAITILDQAIALLAGIKESALSTSQTLFGLLNNRCAHLVEINASAAEQAGRSAISVAERYGGDSIYQADVALALDNYANALTRLDRHADALEATTRALSIYRASSDKSPRAAQALAQTLVNYSVRLGAANRPAEAVDAIKEARGVYKSLSQTDPRFGGEVARTTAELAHNLLAAGYVPQAQSAARKATRLADQLAERGYLGSHEVATIYVQSTKAIGVDAPEALAYADRAVDLCRSAVTDQRLFGTALRNLAAVRGTRGEYQQALELVEESISAFQMLSGPDAQIASEILSALTTKVRLQFSMGLGNEATASARMALECATQIVELTPQAADHVADVLAALAEYGRGIDPEMRVEDEIKRWVARVDEHLRLFFCHQLISRIPATDPAGPPLVVRTLESIPETDREMTFRIHAAARGKRQSAGTTVYDQHWLNSTGTQPPGWLVVDRDLVILLGEWASQPTFGAGLAFAIGHPEVFNPVADVAAEEAYLTIDPQRASRLRSIRDTAHTSGIQAAYRVPLRIDIADVFIDEPLDRQVEMLEALGGVLHDPEVLAYIRETCKALSNTQAFCVAALSNDNVLRSVLSAAGDPSRSRRLLEQFAEDEELKTVQRASWVILAFQNEHSSSPGAGAAATIHLASQQVRSGNLSGARQLVQAALDVDPEAIPGMIESVERLSHTQPEYAELLALIAEAVADDDE